MAFLLGRKLKMSQTWQGEKAVPVTVIEARPNKVSLLRQKERDGYEAVQISMGKTKRESRSHFSEFKVGDEITVAAFAPGDQISIVGTSKGRGFQGVVKRHGFAGGPKTHGQKNRFRAPGSIGSTAFQRVVPGRRMAGRMGNARVTVPRAEVVAVDPERHLLLVKGAVPGAPGSLVEIRKRHQIGR